MYGVLSLNDGSVMIRDASWSNVVSNPNPMLLTVPMVKIPRSGASGSPGMTPIPVAGRSDPSLRVRLSTRVIVGSPLPSGGTSSNCMWFMCGATIATDTFTSLIVPKFAGRLTGTPNELTDGVSGPPAGLTMASKSVPPGLLNVADEATCWPRTPPSGCDVDWRMNCRLAPWVSVVDQTNFICPGVTVALGFTSGGLKTMCGAADGLRCGSACGLDEEAK